MKSYPSIPKALSPPDLPLYTWDKIDGSNLRFEWTRKRGWYKYGTRDRFFDSTDEILGPAIPLFEKTLAEPLAKWARDSRREPFVAFTEFAGPRSFAGLHHPEDEKQIYLIDAANPEGILDPRDFLKLAEKTGVKTTAFLGHLKWNRTLMDAVDQSKLVGVTLEGIVGKVYERKQGLRMWKTKSAAWRQMIMNKFETAVALKLIEN